MKTNKELIEKISLLIEEISLGEIKRINISANAKLIDDLGLDSLDYATIMLQLEQLTHHKINENDVNWAEIQTVEQLANLFSSDK